MSTPEDPICYCCDKPLSQHGPKGACGGCRSSAFSTQPKGGDEPCAQQTSPTSTSKLSLPEQPSQSEQLNSKPSESASNPAPDVQTEGCGTPPISPAREAAEACISHLESLVFIYLDGGSKEECEAIAEGHSTIIQAAISSAVAEVTRERDEARAEASRAWGCDCSNQVVIAMMGANQEELRAENERLERELVEAKSCNPQFVHGSYARSLETERDSLRRELASVRLCFAEASQQAGPTAVHVETLQRELEQEKAKCAALEQGAFHLHDTELVRALRERLATAERELATIREGGR